MATHETVRKVNAVPADDKWFNLEVDNDTDPTYRVKLVRLGSVRNLAEAREKAGEMDYRLVEGQARESFKAKFPKPDGNGPIIFGGFEWQYPGDRAYVADLHNFEGEWYSDFHWSDLGFRGRYRWLVVGK